MNQSPTTDVAQLRAVLAGARDALVSDGVGAGPVGDVLARLSGAELAEFMGLADEVAARARAAQVRLTAEAAHRGEFTSARRGEGSVHSWVREHSPSLRQDGAGPLAQLAQDVASSVPGGLWSTAGPGAGAYANPDKAEGRVWARVLTGEVAPWLALTMLKEMAKLEGQLNPEAEGTVADAILDHGVQWGAAEARRLRPHLLAMFGVEGEFDDSQKKLRKAAYLTSPRVNDADITEYRLGLTPEQAATLEAAIGSLSKPAPNETTGEKDLRPAEQRRAEALAAVCGHVADQDAGQESSPGGTGMTLHVGIHADDLLSHFPDTDEDTPASDTSGSDTSGTDDAGERAGRGEGCGRVMVSRAQATMLAPAVVRQLACDADIIPVVFGSDGSILDVGRAVRLFTKNQRRALWTRDKGCTYPGCDVPSGWAKAHHLIHWVDGGRSDLTNAALLCQRHHTHVHEQRFIASVHPPDHHGRCVTWDLTPGSYDRDLPARLTAIRRVQQATASTAPDRARQRAGQRANLDTGPPDWRELEPPDDVIEGWVEEWMAEEQDRDRDEAARQAEIDDTLATILDEERARIG